MEEKIVLVNEFVGPSYTNGLFGFRYHQEVVPFNIGNHHGAIYHLNMSTIESLAVEFPTYITAFDRKRDKVSEWGPQTEIGLCKLMMEGKLRILREEGNGEKVTVLFFWEGPMWIPRNRPTKRTGL